MTKINWDTESIYELERILNSLSEDEFENVQWDALPSVDFPEDIDTTEVWAMDKMGRVLYGPISDAIEIGFDETESVITLEELRRKQGLFDGLSISYLKHGERFVTDGHIWIICHPEDGEIVASSSDEASAFELFAEAEIFSAKNNAMPITSNHLTPGLRDSIKNVWS